MDPGDAVPALADALQHLGVRVGSAAERAGDHGSDLVLDPGAARIQVVYRSLVDGPAAARLLDRTAADTHQLVVVADRITAAARHALLTGGAGYYDLRGHVAVRTAHVLIDTDIEPLSDPQGRVDPLGGVAGMEIATALLMAPTSSASVRQLARELGRSPSTVSEVLQALRRDDLVDDQRRVVGTRLFWSVAERWTTARTYLSELPPPGQAARVTAPLRLGLTDPQHSAGWALTDSAAAAAFGAPMAVRADQRLDFYVPDRTVLRRAERLLGAAPSPDLATCAVRVAPVPAACSHRIDIDTNPLVWPLAHPLFVALDLAQDLGRGREVLDAWTPSRWPRAW